MKRLPVNMARIEARVDKSTGCWVWLGSKSKRGYGKIGVGGGKSPQGVHRVMWELVNGPIPTGLFVCHHCDNPPCCNPDHLFVGTAKDNVQDAISKGRMRARKVRLPKAQKERSPIELRWALAAKQARLRTKQRLESIGQAAEGRS